MPNLDNPIETIKGSRKTLFILCGLPYSGKTFVARKILETTPVAYVNIDDLFHTHGFSWTEGGLPNTSEWEKIFEESYRVTQDFLKDSKNVLYDSTNHTFASREKLREVAEEIGAETVVIYINVPVSTVWKRWEESSKNQTRPTINKNLVEATINSFESPRDTESMIEIFNG